MGTSKWRRSLSGVVATARPWIPILLTGVPLSGCSRILGLQEGAPVDCLQDCSSVGQHCDPVTYTCVGAAAGANEASVSTSSGESDSAITIVSPDAAGTDATNSATDDAGPILVYADAADDMSDGCGLASSGVCAACPGVNCAVERPGWSQPASTQFVEIAANTFDAVPIDVPNPSWLMQLGVDATNSNATGRLGLYTDAEGQPGDLVAQTDVTIQYDPTSHGTEVTVTPLLLCLPLNAEHYWVGGVFDSPVFLPSNGVQNALRYEGPFADGGSLAGPLAGSIAFALQRNLYVVVTSESPPQ